MAWVMAWATVVDPWDSVAMVSVTEDLDSVASEEVVLAATDIMVKNYLPKLIVPFLIRSK